MIEDGQAHEDKRPAWLKASPSWHNIYYVVPLHRRCVAPRIRRFEACSRGKRCTQDEWVKHC